MPTQQEILSPTLLFEDLQRRPPKPEGLWQRRSPKAPTQGEERKLYRVVRHMPDERDVMRLVIVDESDPAQKERELSLKSFVLGYEPSEKLRKDYEHICLARPERGRREDRPGLHPGIQKVLRAREKAQKTKARRGYRRP